MKKKRCMGIILAVALLMTACNGKNTDTEAGNSEGVGIVETEGVTDETENAGVEETTETTENTEATENTETTENTEVTENTEGVATNPTEDTTATGNGEAGGNSTTDGNVGAGGNAGTGGNNVADNNSANGGGNTGAGSSNGGGNVYGGYVFVRGQALADSIALAEADGQILNTLIDNGTDTIYFQYVISPYGDGGSLTLDEVNGMNNIASQTLVDRGYKGESIEVTLSEIVKKYPLGDREVALYRSTFKGTELKETVWRPVVISMDATVIIGLKQNPTIGRRFSPIFSFFEHLSGKYGRCYT